jgi:hypothetical protein
MLFIACMLFVQVQFINAQETTFVVYDSTGYPHLLAAGNSLSIIHGDSLIPTFLIKKKQITLLSSNKNDDVLFSIERAKGIIGKALRIDYPEVKKTVLTFYNNEVYWGENVNRDIVIGFYEVNDNGQTAFFDAYTGKVLFHFNREKIQNTLLVAITTYFIQLYQLEINTVEQLPYEKVSFAEDEINIVRYNEDGYEEYVWDGNLLHNVTSGNKMNVWAFDGKNIYRYYFETGDDLIWDGESLNRKWVRWENYFKQGNMLMKATANTPMQHQFIIQNNTIRPAWNHNPEIPYIEFYSDIPIALLLALTFRLIH